QKDFVGRVHVGHGLVCVHQVFAAVKFVSGFQRALLHQVVEVLHVDEVAVFDAEIDARAEKFLRQDGHVEFVGIESRQIRVEQKFEKFGGYLREGGGVHDVPVGNAVHQGRF